MQDRMAALVLEFQWWLLKQINDFVKTDCPVNVVDELCILWELKPTRDRCTDALLQQPGFVWLFSFFLIFFNSFL